jgi:hypothetical protein
MFYAGILFFLGMTSVVWHSCKRNISEELSHTLFWSDQIAIWSAFILSIFYACHLRGGWLQSFILISTIMIALALYLISCWCENDDAHTIHYTIHLISIILAICIICGQPA